jgi:hypothetical protein
LPAEPTPNGGGDDLTVTPGTGRVAFTGQVVSLNAEARPYSVQDQIALQDADLRKRVAYWTIGTFIGANFVTLVALGYLARLDQSNIASKLIAPGDRIITSQVFIALLGATTVQVGAIMVIIARYLFPGRP